MIRKTITVSIDDIALLRFYSSNDNDINLSIHRWIETDDRRFMTIEEIHDAREPNLIDQNAQI